MMSTAVACQLQMTTGKTNYCLSSVWLAIVGVVAGCQPGYITPPTAKVNHTLNTIRAETHPRFSYNGQYLVFSSERHSQRQILLYDLQQRRLLPLPGLHQSKVMHDQPDISADGRYIVYVSEQAGKPDIYLYDRVSRKVEIITKNLLAEVRNPTISGNGRFIAFESNRSGQWNIEIYDRGATKVSIPSSGIESDLSQ